MDLVDIVEPRATTLVYSIAHSWHYIYQYISPFLQHHSFVPSRQFPFTMTLSAITSACAGAAFVGNAVAHPGMAKVVNEIKANIMSRQGGPVDPALNSNELIGDS